MSHYSLYTDGSCTRNGFPDAYGAWAWALIDPEGTLVARNCGTEPNVICTVSRMELWALISGLQSWATISSGQSWALEVYADSKYVLDSFRLNWIQGWKLRGWRNAKNKPTPNRDLWELLIPLVETIKPGLNHVHGHTGNQWNEYVDRLAAEESAKWQKS